MKMKRKLVAIVLTLVMVISLVPTFALADGNKREANNNCCISGEASGGPIVSHGTLDELVQSPVMKAQIKKALAEQGIEIKPKLTISLVQMRPWDYVEGTSVLSHVIPLDFDIFVFILRGSGSWVMEIEDIEDMGDTVTAMGRVAGQKVSGTATSPAFATLGPIGVGTFGIGVVVAGYTACPKGFPAGYEFRVWYLPLV
jgi:hypothetical protein